MDKKHKELIRSFYLSFFELKNCYILGNSTDTAIKEHISFLNKYFPKEKDWNENLNIKDELIRLSANGIKEYVVSYNYFQEVLSCFGKEIYGAEDAENYIIDILKNEGLNDFQISQSIIEYSFEGMSILQEYGFLRHSVNLQDKKEEFLKYFEEFISKNSNFTFKGLFSELVKEKRRFSVDDFANMVDVLYLFAKTSDVAHIQFYKDRVISGLKNGLKISIKEKGRDSIGF